MICRPGRWSTSRCVAGWPRAVFEAIVHDLRILLRRAADRPPASPARRSWTRAPSRSTPESGARAGYDGHKRRKGTKVHVAVDTLGHLLALLVTPANEQERAQVAELARAVQAVTGEHVELAVRRSGLHRPEPAEAAAAHGIQLAVVKLPEAKRGFVLLPRRWVVEGTQPQYLQSALDVQTTGSHDRTRWAAEPAHRRQPAEGRSAGLSMCSSGSWCAMSVVPSESAPRASAPPRARALSYAVGGSSCHGPIGNDSCTCSVASSNGS